MRRNDLARMAYRQLEPRVRIILIAQFIVCFGGAILLVQSGTERGAFALASLPFLSQAMVFGAIRFHPQLARTFSRGSIDSAFALFFAVTSALVAVLLLGLAITT